MKKIFVFGVLILLLGLAGYKLMGDKETKIKPTQQVTSIAPSKELTMAEVSTHNNEKDCYLAINDKVYDVTNFIEKHPGGKVITFFCGKDASLPFFARGKKKEPHSEKAQALKEKFFVANLVK